MTKKVKKKMALWKKIVLGVLIALLVALIATWSTVSYYIGVLLAAHSSSVQSLKSEVADKFTTVTYTDSETGLTINYNLYVPEDMTSDETVPMVVFIADSSSAGDYETTAPLYQGLGGMIWASDSEQAKHKSAVLVPQYPEIILDDHDGYTMTDYVEATARMIESVAGENQVDTNRIYGTGQSMGAMTTMYLQATHPDLYAATILVDGQWDISTLSGLQDATFTYFAAGGDTRAVTGQTEVKDMLSEAGISYGELTDVDAQADSSELNTLANDMYSDNYKQNFITYTKGSVLPWYVPTGAEEHLLSFNYGYTIEAVRDWLFEQSK